MFISPIYDLSRQKKNAEYSRYVYTKPWCRAQPYLVGFILGYCIYRSSQQYYNRRRHPVVFWVSAHVDYLIHLLFPICENARQNRGIPVPHKECVKGEVRKT